MPNGYGPNTKLTLQGPNGPVETTLGQLMVAAKIDDDEQDVDFNTLLGEFQKGRTADKRLASAAEETKRLKAERENLAEQVRIAAMVRKLKSTDKTEQAEALKYLAVDVLGESPEAMETFVNSQLAGQNSAAANTGGNSGAVMLTDQHLPPWLQEVRQHMLKNNMTPEQLIASVRGSGKATDHYLEGTAEDQIHEALDKDPVLRLYFNQSNDADGKARGEFVQSVLGEFKRTGKFKDTLTTAMTRHKETVRRIAKSVSAMMPGLGKAANTNPFEVAAESGGVPPEREKCSSEEEYFAKHMAHARSLQAAGLTEGL